MLVHEAKYGVYDHTGATESQNGKDPGILMSGNIFSCLYMSVSH